MNKHSFLTNIFAIIFAIMLIVSGIMIPSLLLRKEDPGMEQIKIFRPREYRPQSISVPNPNDSISEYEELAYRMLAWDDANEMYAREPYAGELGLEQAVDQCISKIQLLSEKDVLSFISMDNFVFSNAALFTKRRLASTDNARWKIEFSHTSQKESMLTIWMDANTDVFYSIEIAGDFNTDKIQDILKGYAGFYGIAVQDGGDGTFVSTDNNIRFRGTESTVSTLRPIRIIKLEMSSNT